MSEKKVGRKKPMTSHVSNLEDWLGVFFIFFAIGVMFTFSLDKALRNINAEVKAIRELLERAIKDKEKAIKEKHENLSDDEWIAAENAKLEAKFKALKKAEREK